MEIQVCRLGVASAQCPLGESVVTCQGRPIHRTAHRAKSASSERSGFFRFEVFEAGAGASVGGEGRSGTVSAALALSSRNLSNSATQTKLRTRLAGGRLAGAPHPWSPAPASTTLAWLPEVHVSRSGDEKDASGEEQLDPMFSWALPLETSLREVTYF